MDELRIILLAYTDKYRNESEKASKLPLEITWVSTTESTTHSSLSASEGSQVIAVMVMELIGATTHE